MTEQTELVYMRETCATSEFYDALELLCCRYGAQVTLTVVMPQGAVEAMADHLRKRHLHSNLTGGSLQVWGDFLD